MALSDAVWVALYTVPLFLPTPFISLWNFPKGFSILDKQFRMLFAGAGFVPGRSLTFICEILAPALGGVGLGMEV